MPLRFFCSLVIPLARFSHPFYSLFGFFHPSAYNWMQLKLYSLWSLILDPFGSTIKSFWENSKYDSININDIHNIPHSIRSICARAPLHRTMLSEKKLLRPILHHSTSTLLQYSMGIQSNNIIPSQTRKKKNRDTFNWNVPTECNLLIRSPITN